MAEWSVEPKPPCIDGRQFWQNFTIHLSRQAWAFLDHRSCIRSIEVMTTASVAHYSLRYDHSLVPEEGSMKKTGSNRTNPLDSCFADRYQQCHKKAKVGADEPLLVQSLPCTYQQLLNELLRTNFDQSLASEKVLPRNLAERVLSYLTVEASNTSKYVPQLRRHTMECTPYPKVWSITIIRGGSRGPGRCQMDEESNGSSIQWIGRGMCVGSPLYQSRYLRCHWDL